MMSPFSDENIICHTYPTKETQEKCHELTECFENSFVLLVATVWYMFICFTLLIIGDHLKQNNILYKLFWYFLLRKRKYINPLDYTWDDNRIKGIVEDVHQFFITVTAGIATYIGLGWLFYVLRCPSLSIELIRLYIGF